MLHKIAVQNELNALRIENEKLRTENDCLTMDNIRLQNANTTMKDKLLVMVKFINGTLKALDYNGHCDEHMSIENLTYRLDTHALSIIGIMKDKESKLPCNVLKKLNDYKNRLFEVHAGVKNVVSLASRLEEKDVLSAFLNEKTEEVTKMTEHLTELMDNPCRAISLEVGEDLFRELLRTVSDMVDTVASGVPWWIEYLDDLKSCEKEIDGLLNTITPYEYEGGGNAVPESSCYQVNRSDERTR